MHRVLITGAGGGIGRSLRETLRGVYPVLRLSDRVPLAPARDGEEVDQTDIADMAQVERMVAGVDGIVHLGGISGENTWENILAGQHHRALQRVRGGAPRRRQAHRDGDLEPRGRVLSARADDRPPRRAAPGQPLRRVEGVFRGARQPLRRQARDRVSLHQDRQFRRRSRSTAGGSRSGSARATTPSSCASGWSTRTSGSRSSTASRATSARGTTMRTPIGSATSRRTIPNPMPPKSSPREADQPKDPVAERYQGGTFCADEYDAERMPE